MTVKRDTGKRRVVHQVDTKGAGLSFVEHARFVSSEAYRLGRELGLGYRAQFLGLLHDVSGGGRGGNVPGIGGMRLIWSRYGDALAAFALEGVHRAVGLLDQSRLLALMAGQQVSQSSSSGSVEGLPSELTPLLPPVSSVPRCSLRGTAEEFMDVRVLASLVLEAEAADIEKLCWGRGDASAAESRGGAGGGGVALSDISEVWLNRARPPDAWTRTWEMVCQADMHQAGLYWFSLAPDLDVGLTLFLAGLRLAVARSARRVLVVAPSAAAAESLRRRISFASFPSELQLSSVVDWGGRLGDEPATDCRRLAMILALPRWDVDVVFLDRQRLQALLFSRHPQDMLALHRLGRSVIVLWGDGYPTHVTLPLLAVLSGAVRRLMSSVIVGTRSLGSFDFLQETLALWELEGWNARVGSFEGHALWTAHGWHPRYVTLGDESLSTGRDIPCRIRWSLADHGIDHEELFSKLAEPRQVLCRIEDPQRVQQAVRMLVSRGVGSVLCATFRHRLEDRIAMVERARRLVELKAPCRFVVDDSVLGLALSFPRVVIEMAPLDVLLWAATCCGIGFREAGGMEVLPRHDERGTDALAVNVLTDLLSAQRWNGNTLWSEELHREYYQRLHDPDAMRNASGPASAFADAVGYGDCDAIHRLGAGPAYVWVLVPDDDADREKMKRAARQGVDRSWLDGHRHKALQWPKAKLSSVVQGGLQSILIRGFASDKGENSAEWYLLIRGDWYEPLLGFVPPES